MTRYLSDQNKVVLLMESGTFGVTSGNGFWPGQVTEFTVEDNEGKIIDRYMGRQDRSFHAVDQGPRDVKGKLTYHMQDARLLFWSIGSVNDVSGTNSVHFVNQINYNAWTNPYVSGTTTLSPPMSFAFEESKQAPGTGRNFIRTIKGVVADTVSMNLSQGEKVNIDCDWIGQTMIPSSGTTTALTEVTTVPYLWNNATITLSGLVLDTATDVVFEVNNNTVAPHYLNGSRDVAVPYYKQRDFTLTINKHIDSNDIDTIYNSLYKSNGVFNTTIDLNGDKTTGSNHLILFMSGCRITDINPKSVVEGAVEMTMVVRPQSVIGSAIDTVLRYNPW